ncbi:Mitochondrial copper homeostasis protein [Scheffersomyces spartinae]|uniref:Cytochrome c oxidase-assembly factor COX23, mitochondrial n=1 Tax=Scheffersomyces spartinae TaxID=45513 RepID=A0A9P8AJA5_9ASCO|nr:Mitochondrial copper homeostasis protein [Scheffersomyces spartinae]KAG7195253.1 Mitochondrial copper homeostasis protein [Scheffersomyces spartinae]
MNKEEDTAASTLSTTASDAEVVTDKQKVDFTKGGPDKFKFYPDNPTNHKHKYNWVMKEPTKFYDPCEESRQASMDCMLRTQDKSDCEDFFKAYRECKADFFANKRKEKIEGKGGWGFW